MGFAPESQRFPKTPNNVGSTQMFGQGQWPLKRFVPFTECGATNGTALVLTHIAQFYALFRAKRGNSFESHNHT